MRAGWGAPAWARNAMAVAGSKVAQALLRARKVIMAGVTVSGRGLRACSSFMARRPKGVAALARPRKLAAMFIAIAVREG